MAELDTIDTSILRLIRESTESKGYPPTVRELCLETGLRGPASMHKGLRRLEREGYLTSERYKPRTLRVVRLS